MVLFPRTMLLGVTKARVELIAHNHHVEVIGDLPAFDLMHVGQTSELADVTSA